MTDDLSLAESEVTTGGSTFYNNMALGQKSHRTNVRFHALQGIERDVQPEIMKIGRQNRDALHKLDLHMVQDQTKINEFYHDNAVSKHRLDVRPSVGEWNVSATASASGADAFKQPRDLGRWVQTTKGLAVRRLPF